MEKHSRRALLGAGALTVALGAIPITSAAADGGAASLRLDLKEALFRRAADAGISLEEINDLSFEPTPEILASYAQNPTECVENLAEEILPGECPDCSEAVVDTPNDDDSESLNGPITAFSTKTYNAKVFSGVPAGGICQIRQDFRATVTNSKVSKVSILGSSYGVGVCVFQWSANRAWHQTSGKVFNLRMKGVFSAVIKGGPVSFSATFKAIYDIRKSDLKQRKQ